MVQSAEESVKLVGKELDAAKEVASGALDFVTKLKNPQKDKRGALK